VRYCTFLSGNLAQHGGVQKTKREIRAMRETRAQVNAEMAQPRKALSVRLTEARQKLATAKKARLRPRKMKPPTPIQRGK